MDIVFNITTILGSESSQGDFPFPIRTLEEAIENQMVELHPELAGVRVVISSAKLDPTFDTSLHIASDDFVPDFEDTGDDDETDDEYDRPDREFNQIGKRVRITGCILKMCNGQTGTLIEVLEPMRGHDVPWYEIKLDNDNEDGRYCTTESFEEIIPDGTRVRITGCISGWDNNKTGRIHGDQPIDSPTFRVDADLAPDLVRDCVTYSVERI